MGTPAVASRKQSIQYVSGAIQSTELTRGNIYRQISLRLTQQPTLVEADNVAADYLPGDDWAAISQIQLIYNGNNYLLNVPGYALWWISKFITGRNAMIPTNIASTIANPALDTTIVIPFMLDRMKRPFDTALYTGKMDNFRLQVQWAANAYSAVNTDASAYTTPPVLEVNSLESTVPVLPNAASGAANVAVLPKYNPRIAMFTGQPTGANTAYRINLDCGLPRYAALFIHVTTTASPPVDSGSQNGAAKFSNLRIVSGSTVYCDKSEGALWAEGRSGPMGSGYNQYQTAAGVPSLNGPRISSSTSEAGWYAYWFCPDGSLTESVNTKSLSEFYCEFNVSAACTIEVYALQLIPTGYSNVQTSRKATSTSVTAVSPGQTTKAKPTSAASASAGAT